MNKEQLLELLESLKIDRKDFWILSTGALVMRNIYPKANDLDIAVTDDGLEELKRNYSLKEKGNGWYEVNDLVECVCDGKLENLFYQPEECEGYYLQNIEEYFNFLLASNREKDKLKLEIVKEYIQNKRIR